MSDVDAIVPAATCTLEDLYQWYVLQDDLRNIKAKEMALRTRLFKFHFPAPDEGTNTVELDPVMAAAGVPADGRVLKGGHTINREVDPAALQTLGDKFKEAGINPANLINWKPSLKVSDYKELTKEQRQLFDQCLIVKPGAPSLEVVLPAKRKPKVDKT